MFAVFHKFSRARSQYGVRNCNKLPGYHFAENTGFVFKPSTYIVMFSGLEICICFANDTISPVF